MNQRQGPWTGVKRPGEPFEVHRGPDLDGHQLRIIEAIPWDSSQAPRNFEVHNVTTDLNGGVVFIIMEVSS